MKAPAHQRRRMNLIPEDMRPSLVNERALLALAVAVIVGLPALGLAGKGALWVAQRSLQEEIARRDGISQELTAQTQKQNAIAEPGSAAALSRALAQRLYWAEAFKELTNVAPRAVWLTAFEAAIDGGAKKVTIAGNSTSQAEIAEFYARLEHSFYFRDVQIKFTEAEGGNPSLFRFQFEGKVFEDSAGGQHGPT